IDPATPNLDNLHSLNRYAYGNNNPYKYVDPDGRSAALAFGIAIPVAIGTLWFASQSPERQQAMVRSLSRGFNAVFNQSSGDGVDSSGPRSANDAPTTATGSPSQVGANGGARTEPKDHQEELALEEAKAGAGEKYTGKLGDKK